MSLFSRVRSRIVGKRSGGPRRRLPDRGGINNAAGSAMEENHATIVQRHGKLWKDLLTMRDISFEPLTKAANARIVRAEPLMRMGPGEWRRYSFFIHTLGVSGECDVPSFEDMVDDEDQSVAVYQLMMGNVKMVEHHRQSTAQSMWQSLADDQPALFEADQICGLCVVKRFDWPDVTAIVEKIREELDEVVEAWQCFDHEAVESEIGDLLLSVVNLAHRLDVRSEPALHRANLKFRRRFDAMMAKLESDGRAFENHDPSEMENAWQVVKQEENI